MLTIYTRRRSCGAALLVVKLNALGYAAQLQVGGRMPQGALRWGWAGGNKYLELQKLAAAGVPVPAHDLAPHTGWLARKFRHHGANDLLRGRRRGDYYVEYTPTLREHRVHVFGGRSIRVAMKVPRPDVAAPHERFRTWDGGWQLKSAPAHTALLPRHARQFAKQAVEALGLEFGAVDVGTTLDGGVVVFEVNSGPGIEGRTVECYARAIVNAGR